MAGFLDVDRVERTCARCGKVEITRVRTKPYYCVECRPIRRKERSQKSESKRRNLTLARARGSRF